MLTIKNRVEQKTLVEQIAEQIAEQIRLSKSVVMVPWDGSMALFYGVIFAQPDLLNPPFFLLNRLAQRFAQRFAHQFVFAHPNLLNDLLTDLLTDLLNRFEKDKCGFELHGRRSGK